VQLDSTAYKGRNQWFIPLVINLSHREDRMINAICGADELGLNFVRIEAINADDFTVSPLFVTKGALACWESHKLAMRALLDSSHSFALILEDDFQVFEPKRLKQLLDCPERFEGIDIFQFGFLVNDYKERIDLVLKNIENFIFSLLGRINFKVFRFNFCFSNRLRVRRKLQLPFTWVADDFRAGAHSYLISKAAAKRILSLNEPTFLTTDAFFVSLNSVKAFRICRSSKSLVGQIDSPSSIKNWGAEVLGGFQD